MSPFDKPVNHEAKPVNHEAKGENIIRRPINNPLYDRAATVVRDNDRRLRFFYTPIGGVDTDGHVKTAADTNMYVEGRKDVCYLPPGVLFYAYGLYMCPCLRDVPEERYAEVRREVAAIRWKADVSLRFGQSIYTSVPAACVLANVIGHEPEVEAVPITDNVRAMKVKRPSDGETFRDEWKLSSCNEMDPDNLLSSVNQFPITIQDLPVEITTWEEWHVRLENVPLPLGKGAHLRAFVNGIILRGLV